MPDFEDPNLVCWGIEQKLYKLFYEGMMEYCENCGKELEDTGVVISGTDHWF